MKNNDQDCNLERLDLFHHTTSFDEYGDGSFVKVNDESRNISRNSYNPGDIGAGMMR